MMAKTAGYSGTPLIRKLGIKEGFRISLTNEPADYWTLLGKLPRGVDVVGPRAGSLHFIHGFVTRQADLEKRMPGWRRRSVPAGMIWVSWPKKSSGVTSDVTEDVVRAVAFANELVDVKVCAVDETWSGLKLVIRRADRSG